MPSTDHLTGGDCRVYFLPMNWDVDTPEGLANAVAWMEQFVATCGDQFHWIIPRSCSIVVIDTVNKRATLTWSMAPWMESSTQKVVEAMGWKWVDKTDEEGP